MFTWVCGRHCWVTTLATCSLLFAGRVWVSMEWDKSWSVSTSNDNPFLITSNGVVLGPNSRHIYKGYQTRYFWKRCPQIFKESWGWCGILHWTLSCWEVMLGYVSTMTYITKVWQSRKTKNWGPEGDSEPLDQPSMEPLRLRTVLLWKTQYLLQPVDLGLLLLTEDTKWHFCRSHTTEKWTLGKSFILSCWYRDLFSVKFDVSRLSIRNN